MSNCNTTNESDMDNLSLLEQMGEFELVPSDTVYDFEDKFRFTKLSLSEAQKMHLSAAYQHKIAETIVQNTTAKNQKVLTMDSMQSTTSKDVANGTTYLYVMEKNLSVLKEALD